MALETAGVKLTADGLDQFVASMGKAESKARDFATQLLGAARAENTFDVAMQKVVNSALAAQDRLAAQTKTASILATEITLLSQKYGESSVQVQKKEAALARLNTQIAGTERQIGTFTAQIIEMASKTEAATKDQIAQANAMEEQRRAYAMMAASVDQLTEEYGANSAEVKAQKASLDAMAGSLIASERAAERTAAGIDRLGNEFATNSKHVDRFREMTVGALREIGQMGLERAMDALSSIGGFFTDSIKLAGDFEGAMMRFKSVTGGAMQEAGLSTQQFTDLFLKMGAETQYSALQAANAAVELAKGGIAPATIAAGALSDALTLASAGELELATAADITAKQLGVWANTGVTSADVANLMAQAANASTVGVEELALGLANAGGVAKVTGLSFRETVTAMAQLAPGFSSAADAGTSFKAFLAGLTNTSKPAIKAMEELGLRTEDGKNKFFDATGSFIGMREATELLSTATAGLSEEQTQMALKAIFGSDAIRAAAIFAEGGAKAYDDMGKAMGTAGDASTQAAAKQQGYNANMEQFQGSLETIQVVIGTKILPAITAMVGALTSAANALGDFLQADDKLADLHGTVLKGAKSFTEYAKKVSVINEKSSWWMDETEQLTEAQFELAQSLIKTGVESSTAMQRATASTSDYAFVLDEMTRRTADPNVANGLKAIDSQMLALVEHGGGWATSVDAAFAKFQDSGDINALINDINGLSKAYTEAQQSLSIEQSTAVVSFEALGIAADRSSATMRGMTDAAQRYAQIAPAVVAVNNEVAATAALSKEQLEGFEKQLGKIAEKGTALASTIVNQQADYQVQVKKDKEAHDATMLRLFDEYNAATTQKDRDRIAKQIEQEQAGYTEQANTAAIAYGAQRIAQQAHLGELLIQHVQAWGAMNGISQERINEMTGQIVTKFGVAKDSTVLLFGEMTTAAEGWLLGTETSADGVATRMIDNQNVAANAAARYKEIFATMKGDLDQQLSDGKINIDQYNAKLAEIPARVEVVIETSLNNQKLMDDANTAQAEARGKGQDVGTAFNEGIAQGIANSKAVVAAAAMAAVDHSAEAARWRAGIRSPSRLFADTVGQPISQGIAIGIIEGEAGILAAIQQVIDGAAQTGSVSVDQLERTLARDGQAAMDALKGAINGAAGGINDAIKGALDGAIMSAEERTRRLKAILGSIGDQLGGGGGGNGGGSGNTPPKPGFGGFFAEGGHAAANVPIVVGDGGTPELFIPDTAGTIVPPSQPSPVSYVNYNNQSSSTSYNYSPSYGGPAPSPAYDFGLMMARGSI